MKKLVILTISLLAMFILTACDTTLEETPINVMNNKTTLGVLSYVSTSFLDETVAVSPLASIGIMQLSADKPVQNPTTSIEDRLELINIYLDKLKGFIENGIDDFTRIEEIVSDRLEFEYLIRFVVDDQEYLLYYNEDSQSQDVTGLFIFDGVEYTIQTENNSSTSDDENETKHNIKLIARNGSNSIIIEYESKVEDDESKQSYKLVKNIDGSIDVLEIVIKEEGEEYVLELLEDENEYKFKLDNEEDGVQAYKLDYIIDGNKGKVRIIEGVNELGDTIYLYRIQERNVKIDIEMDDPDNDDEFE